MDLQASLLCYVPVGDVCMLVEQRRTRQTLLSSNNFILFCCCYLSWCNCLNVHNMRERERERGGEGERGREREREGEERDAHHLSPG